MLTVVFGAGASFDSVLEGARQRVEKGLRNFCPPLAKELFDDRDNFGEVMLRYSDSIPIISRIRPLLREGTVSLERELEKFQEQAARDETRLRQLTAIRFYLQRILWECGMHWRDLAHEATNYVALLDRIHEWHVESGERVCYVTFNYDTLLEHGAARALGLDLSSIETFVAEPSNYLFIKLHGSVTWGRKIEEQRWPEGQEESVRKFIIENAPRLKVSGEYAVLKGGISPIGDEGAIYFPAIAIPVETKTEFECPDDHVGILKEALPETERLLIVGWRGAEKTFLSMLSTAVGSRDNLKIQIVNGNSSASQETLGLLHEAGVKRGGQTLNSGFTDYLARDEIHALFNWQEIV